MIKMIEYTPITETERTELDTDRTEPAFITALRLELIEQIAGTCYESIKEDPNPERIRVIKDMLYALRCPIE